MREKKKGNKRKTHENQADTKGSHVSRLLHAGLGKAGGCSGAMRCSCAPHQKRAKCNDHITPRGPRIRRPEELASRILQSGVAKASLEPSLKILKRKFKFVFRG